MTEMEDTAMTAPEMDRLAEWLKSKGHTPEEVLECLKYIASR